MGDEKSLSRKAFSPRCSKAVSWLWIAASITAVWQAPLFKSYKLSIAATAVGCSASISLTDLFAHMNTAMSKRVFDV